MWRESEEEDGGREVPPGIVVEREKEEKEDRKRTDNLVARVQKLETNERDAPKEVGGDEFHSGYRGRECEFEV